jgi:hypothetical protein
MHYMVRDRVRIENTVILQPKHHLQNRTLIRILPLTITLTVTLIFNSLNSHEESEPENNPSRIIRPSGRKISIPKFESKAASNSRLDVITEIIYNPYPNRNCNSNPNSNSNPNPNPNPDPNNSPTILGNM